MLAAICRFFFWPGPALFFLGHLGCAGSVKLSYFCNWPFWSPKLWIPAYPNTKTAQWRLTYDAGLHTLISCLEPLTPSRTLSWPPESNFPLCLFPPWIYCHSWAVAGCIVFTWKGSGNKGGARVPCVEKSPGAAPCLKAVPAGSKRDQLLARAKTWTMMVGPLQEQS